MTVTGALVLFRHLWVIINCTILKKIYCITLNVSISNDLTLKKQKTKRSWLKNIVLFRKYINFFSNKYLAEMTSDRTIIERLYEMQVFIRSCILQYNQLFRRLDNFACKHSLLDNLVRSGLQHLASFIFCSSQSYVSNQGFLHIILSTTHN